MPISVRRFWLPKAGNREEEYEDATWPARSLRAEHAPVRCAIADGATESAFAGHWARQLVRAYGAGAFEDHNLAHTLRVEQTRWQAEVLSRPLPWYAEEKARSGAFAALLGVTLEEDGADGRHRWRALAVGDCALLHVRDGVLLHSFPAQDAAFFTSRPVLIPSVGAQHETVVRNLRQCAGEFLPGDVLYLVTDALGQWLLSRIECGESPWVRVEAAIARRRRDFVHWIGDLRNHGQMRNDDVTLVRIAWSER